MTALSGSEWILEYPWTIERKNAENEANEKSGTAHDGSDDDWMYFSKTKRYFCSARGTAVFHAGDSERRRKFE